MKSVIGWRWVLAAAVGHFALAGLVLSIAPFDGKVLPVWPTTGLSLALTAWGGPRFGLAAMVGVAAAALAAGSPVDMVFVANGIGNLLESVVGGALLARRLNWQQPFHTLREVLWLPVAALAAAAVNAGVVTLATAVVQRSLWPSVLQDTITWWLGNAMGGLLVAPLVAGLLALRRSDWADRRTPESAGLVLLSALLALTVFGNATQGLLHTESFPFLLFPVMVCLALRGSPLALAAMSVVVSAIGLLATAQGQGPFAADNTMVGLARLQLFLFVLCGTGLILAALNDQWSVAQQLADDRLSNLQALLNYLPSVAWSSDETGRAQFISANVRKVIGFSAEEVTASASNLWFGRIHPDDLPQVRASHDRLFRDGKFDIEYRYQAQDGRWLWLRDQGNLVDQQIDGQRFAVGVFSDITTRKQAELDLHEEQTILQCQIDLSKDGILVVAPDRRRLSINARMAEIFQMPRDLLDNWSSQRALALAAEQVVDPEAYLAPIQRLYPDPHSIWDDIVKLKDGRVLARYSAPIRDAQQHYFGRIWYYRDVTVERQAEEFLRQTNQALEQRVAERTTDLKASQQLFEHLAEVSPVGIFKTDAEGACQYVNRRWTEITGLTMQQAIGDGWTSSLHSEDRQRVFDAWRRSALSGVHFQEEYRFLDPAGRESWVLGQARALRDDHGAVTGYVGTITDITAHKDAESRLQRQQNELAHVGRLNTIGEMSAALVHELGQPLTAISNYAAGCLTRVEKNNVDLPLLVAAVQKIENESKRAAEIIRLVRNFIRKRPPIRPELDVNKAVRDTLAMAAHESRRKGIALETELAEPALVVRADAVELQQVLLNLVRNAKEALAASTVERPFVRVTTRKNEQGEVEIIVRDNGPGLSPEVARTAFEPFHTTKPDGLGLGLAICRSLVESLGGRLALVDNSAQGALFCCTLPAAWPATGDRHG